MHKQGVVLLCVCFLIMWAVNVDRSLAVARGLAVRAGPHLSNTRSAPAGLAVRAGPNLSNTFLTLAVRGVWSAVLQRQARERLNESASDGAGVIALLVPTISRPSWKDLEDSPVIRHLLPSFLRTVSEGWAYRVYVGHDEGDAFYEKEGRREELVRWFHERGHLRASVRARCSFTVVRFENKARLPGPMFNFLSASAVADGADYLYRVNDDTELMGPWAGGLVGYLQSLRPRNVGVAGPTCMQGNRAILTHDFVHRTHVLLHGLHYPSELTDWWLDDWISRVYGENRTSKLAGVRVVHHLEKRRYRTNHTRVRLLEPLLRSGRDRIEAFLARNCRAGAVCEDQGLEEFLAPLNLERRDGQGVHSPTRL